jgi:UDPglucose 6-dehydrogenase
LRESPAIAVVRELTARGARVRTYEPNAPGAAVEGAVPALSLEQALTGADALVLLVDHRPFRSLDPAAASRWMAGRVVFDARGVLPRAAWRQAGFALHVLGTGAGHG